MPTLLMLFNDFFSTKYLDISYKNQKLPARNQCLIDEIQNTVKPSTIRMSSASIDKDPAPNSIY